VVGIVVAAVIIIILLFGILWWKECFGKKNSLARGELRKEVMRLKELYCRCKVSIFLSVRDL
jgi:hypothetical protein